MSSHFPDIINQLNKYSDPSSLSKSDGSPVTELDFALSLLIKEIKESHFPNCSFYSEEDLGEWKFPLFALDPLDGTREFIAGRPEWAVSVGVFENDNFSGQGWVANPVTDEIFTQKTVSTFMPKKQYRGEASRTEFDEGLFKNFASGKFQLDPKGSIAYKLGKLSHGKIDFVVSLRPKNIWDIAGGTLLCKEAGLKFYSEGKEVTKVEKTYGPPLLWCHPSLLPELLKLFSS